MMPAIPILGAAVLAGGGIYLATKKDGPPEVQSSKHTTADGTPVQLVVPTDAPVPRPSVTQVPIAGRNAMVISGSGTGKRYIPPTAIKARQVPGRLDLLPTVITPTGASSLAVMTVADIQNALNTLGFGPLAVDGKAGTSTQAAVRKFQAQNNLQVDGVVGKNTMQQLQHALANLAAPPAQAAVGARPVVTSATAGTPAKIAAGANAAIGIASLAGANARTQRDLATAGSVAANVASLFSGATRFGALEPYGQQPGYGRAQRGQHGMAGAQGTPNQLRNPSRMGPGESLQPQLDGQTKYVGRGQNRLAFQTDGNLVLYGPNQQPVWASGTNKKGISRLSMDANGNLAIYDNSGHTAWTSNTAGNPGAYLEVTARDAVIRAAQGGAVLWSASRQGNQANQAGQAGQPILWTHAQSRYGFGDERIGITTVVRPVQSVREIQESLNFLGASPPLLVDGRPGRKTAAAIKVFQITHGLLADGFAGPKTLSAMTICVAENQRPERNADFGLTLFTLFGGDELPDVGGRAEFGRAAARRSTSSGSRRPAPPRGQMVNGQYVPTASGTAAGAAAAGGGHHHHHHHKKDQDQSQQPPPDPGSGGGSPSGGGAGDAGGSAAAAPPPATSAPMDDGGGAAPDDGSGGVSDAPDTSSDDSNVDGSGAVGFGAFG